MKPFNIIIADINEKNRRELTEFLESNYYCTVIGQAQSGESFLQLGNIINKADVVILDVLMFKFSGYQLAQRIAIQFPHTKIIALVMPDDYKYLTNLVDINLKEIIYKSSLYAEIIPALEVILEGRSSENITQIYSKKQKSYN